MKTLRSLVLLPLAMMVFASLNAGVKPGHNEPAGISVRRFPAAQQQSANSAAEPWWRHAVIYEIYPRSFGDTNGDGLGDLNGITAHLDYLKDLGVNAIWITPCFPSPQVDFGYDVSDYTAIAPEYGTMADFDRLMTEAKKRNIRVLLDFVVNHTSDRHPWFIESASSRTNPKSDWYIWRDGKGADGRQVPNNWISLFGGTAWEWGTARGQYYYHMFYKQQPDLNWRNPDVRKAMYDVMRFWMDKGVSGFRLDAVETLFEDPKLTDDPVKPGKGDYGDPNIDHVHTMNLPEMHDVFRDMRRVANQYPGGMLIAEVYYPTTAQMETLYGKGDEMNLPMATQVGFTDQRSAPLIRRKLDALMAMPKDDTPLMVFDNHDNPRSWDRYGAGLSTAQRAAFAKVIAATLLAPRGSALMYYGQEIGMKTTDPVRREDVQDPVGRIGWPKDKGRDGERTPMQWDETKNSGFSTADKTWLPVPPTYKKVNVADEEKDPNSILNFYKAILHLRSENAALRDGGFREVNGADTSVLAFVRSSPQAGTVLVAINYAATPRKENFRAQGQKAKALLSTFGQPGQEEDLGALTLPPFGVFIGQVQ